MKSIPASGTETDVAEMLHVAQLAAVQAGQLARRMLAEPREISSKGRRDIVTDADVAAQALITEQIRTAFPRHGFVPEEPDSDLPTEGPVLWIIDPIDGTTNYSRGLPIFAVSIAAVLFTAPGPATIDDVLVGVVYDPMQEELFTAVRGGAALVNGRPLHVSAVDRLEEAIIGIDWSHEPQLRQRGLEVTAGLVHDVDVLRTIGSAALALAWVAAGRDEAYLNFQLKPWDVAAAGLMIRLAGGSITDLAGQPLALDPRGLNCLASNNHLHTLLAKRLGASATLPIGS